MNVEDDRTVAKQWTLVDSFNFRLMVYETIYD